REVIRLLVDFRKVITRLARRYIDIVMPGYTHLQRAQPVLLSHHLMAYQEMFSRDEERFRSCLERIDVMPLGSAALAGTPHPIDREYTAELLGFPKISRNSIDSVSDRDFMIEFIAAANICMMHLSRLSEELIIWSTAEFNFIELPDAFSTGSSIMPQKKNPDVCELVRGKASRVLGDLTAMLTLMKAQPLAYNRDMQEDKEPLFHTVDALTASLEIYNKMLPALKINREVMEKAANIGCLNATDLADYLVDRGMPFRKAHGVVGGAVHCAIENGKELHELSLKELRGFSSLIKKDVFDVLTTRSMIDRRLSFGGTATKNVIAAIELIEKELVEKELADRDEE
ncbi:MAG: argininosuccinate lyase, partial [Desulfobacterales bacterium]|nr:argininosuccinate lyase [Desulfobacterales bacterium]